MKAIAIILILFGSHFTSAQTIEAYYDYRWQSVEPANATFYSIIEQKNDVWFRKDYFISQRSLQMEGSYKDKDCKINQGKFSYYYVHGILEATGAYENGKRQGLWLSYHPNGMMLDSATYEKGIVVGVRMRWHSNGFISDSVVLREDGSGVAVQWYDNGNPSSAGYYAIGFKEHGKWQYFHKNGNKSADEVYQDGKLLSKQYYDETGNPIKDTANKDREAEFKGGPNAWQRYVLNRLIFPRGVEITNTNQVVVVVRITIDEEGKVEDAWVDTPVHPEFDKIALGAVLKSPKWLPAISHNRKVKAYRRQPMTFQQE